MIPNNINVSSASIILSRLYCQYMIIVIIDKLFLFRLIIRDIYFYTQTAMFAQRTSKYLPPLRCPQYAFVVFSR